LTLCPSGSPAEPPSEAFAAALPERPGAHQGIIYQGFSDQGFSDQGFSDQGFGARPE
jgi:hypothetical protein